MGLFDPLRPAILPPPPQEDENDDDTPFIKRRCFVVMPFGHKYDSQQLIELARTGFKMDPDAHITSIDFDQIYNLIIRPAVEAAKIECTRADKAGQSGFIHREMLEHLATDDIVIVDVTTQNANVFYELGVRHCFRRSTTILIKRQGTSIPFNILGMRAFDYSDDNVSKDKDGKTPLQRSIEVLTDAVTRSFRFRDNDSLVHNLLPNVTVSRTSFPIMEQRWTAREVINFKKEKIGRKIGFVTGDLMNVRDVDAWVNPENTSMEMARIHDGSVSALIRYFSAPRDRRGNVTSDRIRNELLTIAGRAGVQPATVIATDPGELGKSNNVRAILHVAALQGEPGYGYQPLRDYPGCVRRVFREIERLNRAPNAARSPLRAHYYWQQPRYIRSLVIPLFGSRSAQHSADEVAVRLFRAAAVNLEQCQDEHLKAVYFLAYSEQDRQACETALGALAALDLIEPHKDAPHAHGVPPQCAMPQLFNVLDQPAAPLPPA